MAVREKDVGADLRLVAQADVTVSQSEAGPVDGGCDWRLLYEREVVRAEAAEAQAEEWRRAEIAARSELGSLKGVFQANRNKLIEARDEAAAIRRASKNAVSLQEEVQRLTELLAAARVDPGKRSTAVSLRMQIAELREENGWLRERLSESLGSDAPRGRGKGNWDALAERSRNRGELIKSLRTERGGLRKQVTRLNRELVRLQGRLERQKEQSESFKATIRTLHDEGVGLRRQLRYHRDQADTVRSLSEELKWLRWNLRGSEARRKKLTERIVKLRANGATLSTLPTDEAARLRNALRRSRRQKTTIRSLMKENARLRRSVRVSLQRRQTSDVRAGGLRTRNKELSRSLSDKDAELRKALRRSRRQKTTIKSLRMANGRLRKAVHKSKSRQEALEAELAEVRASRAVLSKWLYGGGGEQQDKPRSTRRRGQQRGAPGHGRTQRGALEERVEVHNPPAAARVCAGCGQAYTANGSEVSTLVEIEVAAHKRVIRRPRWRRSCACGGSPREVSSPPVPRLFLNTPYGTSVWARFLFERYGCLRPLHRVAGWLSEQGLAISPGTLGDSVHRFVPLFEGLAQAILAHQNEAVVRHGDETGWRIQSLREAGRSPRAWLWTSVSEDAVYFHIDPSRSAEVARKLFGAATRVQWLVCDRHSAYASMARELNGAVILSLCWAHQRRDFIHCAAGEVGLTQWCQEWIVRIGSIYRLNKARLAHHDPAAGRQPEAFTVAQRALESAVERLFAAAERELAELADGAPQAKPLSSLLRHREGLCVFVERPQVPMDNNAAERALRSAVIGRRLSFGSDSESGAAFTAVMYSVVGTLALNGIDVRRWLEAWLGACAGNGGQAPPDLSAWLPWSMSESRRRALSRAP